MAFPQVFNVLVTYSTSFAMANSSVISGVHSEWTVLLVGLLGVFPEFVVNYRGCRTWLRVTAVIPDSLFSYPGVAEPGGGVTTQAGARVMSVPNRAEFR